MILYLHKHVKIIYKMSKGYDFWNALKLKLFTITAKKNLFSYNDIIHYDICA